MALKAPHPHTPAGAAWGHRSLYPRGGGTPGRLGPRVFVSTEASVLAVSLGVLPLAEGGTGLGGQPNSSVQQACPGQKPRRDGAEVPHLVSGPAPSLGAPGDVSPLPT